MERKTMGAFIAVLRKSSGMTQRELAEKLGVSDKTISHWERDESAPDISIIPIIADIFSVSCDELLRGEKMPPIEKENKTELSQKSEKQIKYLLEKNITRHKILSIVAFAIMLFGLSLAIIFRYLVYAYIIPIAIMCTFCIISSILLAISHISLHGKLAQNESFDEKLLSSYRLRRNSVTFAAAFFISLLNTYTVVLIANVFGFSWLVFGFAAVISISIVFAFIGIHLKNQGKLPIKERNEVQKKLIKLRIVCMVIAVLFIGAGVLVQIAAINNFLFPNYPSAVHFKDKESFISFMQQETPAPKYAADMEESHDYQNNRPEQNENGMYILENCDENGNTVNTVEFDWNNNSVAYIDLICSLDEKDSFAVDVYTYKAIHDYQQLGPVSDMINMLAYAYYPLMIIIAFAVYFPIAGKIKHGGSKKKK